jgi:hypothetical protein
MTSPLLEKLSEWFYVSVEWLEGTASRPVHHYQYLMTGSMPPETNKESGNRT